MSDAALYWIILLQGILCAIADGANSILEGNIVHVENGRPPNASYAIFPNVPFMQLLPLGLAWGLNSLPGLSGIGSLIVIGLLVLYLGFGTYSYFKLKQKFESLLKVVRVEQVID